MIWLTLFLAFAMLTGLSVPLTIMIGYGLLLWAYLRMIVWIVETVERRNG